MPNQDKSSILKKGVIVSCQAEANDPFNNENDIAKFALAAQMGGAVGIRSEGINKTKSVIETVKIPVIGLVKSKFDDGLVKITGSFKDVENLINISCNIIAIDGTERKREDFTGPEFIRAVKNRYQVNVMADVATLEEAIACERAGADLISTTLNGYTPNTQNEVTEGPNINLIKTLLREITIPVIAEGRISTKEEVRTLFQTGLKNIVIGTAITRPRLITKMFVESIY